MGATSNAGRDHPPIPPQGQRPRATTGIFPALMTAQHLFLKREEDRKEIINSSTTHKTLQGPEHSAMKHVLSNLPGRRASPRRAQQRPPSGGGLPLPAARADLTPGRTSQRVAQDEGLFFGARLAVRHKLYIPISRNIPLAHTRLDYFLFFPPQRKKDVKLLALRQITHAHLTLF